MAAIRGKNTTPEMIVRRGLYAKGLRFRLHRRNLPGTPDLVFPGRRVAVFVHGCFWHAHEGCNYFKLPQTDPDRWQDKLMGNRNRDMANENALRLMGWKVIVVWECELRRDASQRLSDLVVEITATNLLSG